MSPQKQFETKQRTSRWTDYWPFLLPEGMLIVILKKAEDEKKKG